MIVEFEVTPDMFYKDFDFCEGEVQLSFPYDFKNYSMDIWGIDLFIGNEKFKKQIPEKILEQLYKNFEIKELLNGKYGGLFINGVSKLYFQEVIQINLTLELLENKSAKRILNFKNQEIILEYKRGEKNNISDSKIFEFPDANVYFPYSWMYGKIYTKQNAKLVIDFNKAILTKEYIANAKTIVKNYRNN